MQYSCYTNFSKLFSMILLPCNRFWRLDLGGGEWWHVLHPNSTWIPILSYLAKHWSLPWLLTFETAGALRAALPIYWFDSYVEMLNFGDLFLWSIFLLGTVLKPVFLPFATVEVHLNNDHVHPSSTNRKHQNLDTNTNDPPYHYFITVATDNLVNYGEYYY